MFSCLELPTPPHIFSFPLFSLPCMAADYKTPHFLLALPHHQVLLEILTGRCPVELDSHGHSKYLVRCSSAPCLHSLFLPDSKQSVLMHPCQRCFSDGLSPPPLCLQKDLLSEEKEQEAQLPSHSTTSIHAQASQLGTHLYQKHADLRAGPCPEQLGIAVGRLACQCLHQRAKCRPPMTEVNEVKWGSGLFGLFP